MEKNLLHSLALLTVSGLSIILQVSFCSLRNPLWFGVQCIWNTDSWGCSALWVDSLPSAMLSLLPSARAQVGLG